MGQNCIGIERFIIHSALYEEFMAEMSERIRKLRVGSVLSTSAEGFISVVDGGSMINDTRFDSLERVIRDAVTMGAHLVCGGTRLKHPYHEAGSYFAPTLLGNVTDKMEIAQSEGWLLITLIPKSWLY